MNTHIPSPDKLLHAWLDEELDPSHEPQFFAHLATDADLREKLRQLRSVRDEARRFGAAAEPPKATTVALFEKLGFEAESKSTVQNLGAIPIPLFKRAWAPVTAAAAAAAITAILFLGLQNTEVQRLPNEFADAGSAQAAQVESPTRAANDVNNNNSAPGFITTEDNAADSAPVTTQSPENSANATPTTEDIFATTLDSAPTNSGFLPNNTAASPTYANTATTVETALPTSNDNALYNESYSPTSRDISTNSEVHAPTLADILTAINDIPAADINTDDPVNNAAPAAASITTDIPESTPTEDGIMQSNGELSPIFGDNVDIDESFAVLEEEEQPPSAWVSPTVQDDIATESASRFGPSNTDGMHALRELPGDGRMQAVDTRQYFPTLANSDLSSSISIEIRGMNTVSFPEATMGTASNPWMQNMAIAVYHGVDQHDLGLEYGQEPFAMHYHGVENGKAVRYEQNLLTPWILASWRYRMEPISALAGIEPYVMAGAGSSLQLWPTARAGIGLMYMPDRRVRFNVGLEGSLLAYPYQSNWFTSHRYGLTYGLSVLF